MFIRVGLSLIGSSWVLLNLVGLGQLVGLGRVELDQFELGFTGSGRAEFYWIG